MRNKIKESVVDQNKAQDEYLGHIEGAIRDGQSITADWVPLQGFIDGVHLREVKNVIKNRGGILTEVFRSDWGLDHNVIDQVFQNVLNPKQISGWHVHAETTDRIFINLGLMKVVLFDGRKNSPTYGVINEFMLGDIRPGLLIVPPGIWHAVQNISHTASALLNLVDKAYQYEGPDHIRLPIDSPKIPYDPNKWK